VLSAAALCACLLGCASVQPPIQSPTPSADVSRVLYTPQSAPQDPLILSPIEDQAPLDTLSYALSLLGTAYRYGGTSPKEGFDCSGFVQYVYRRFGVGLPRIAREMAQQLPPVDSTEKQPGDLVFFNTNGRSFSHVGIYLGADRFIHATSRTGKTVKISSLWDAYWRRRLNGLRRPTGSEVKSSYRSVALR